MKRVDQRDGREYYPKINPSYLQTEGSVYGQPDPNVLDLIRKLPKNERVLELGAGDGRYTFTMVKQGLNVVATDYQVSARDALILRRGQLEDSQQRQVMIIDQPVNAFERLPFADGSFDALVVTGFLYLFPPEMIGKAFTEARRVLKPRGRLIFDFATELQRVSDEEIDLKGQDEMHYLFYNGYGTIDQLLQETGFGVSDRNISFIREHVPAGYTISNTKINVLAQKI